MEQIHLNKTQTSNLNYARALSLNVTNTKAAATLTKFKGT